MKTIDSVDLALYGDGFSWGRDEIILEYPGTKAASRSAYMIGIIKRNSGHYIEAIDAFEQVNINDDLIMSFALAAIGDCYSELNEFQTPNNMSQRR